MKKLQRKAKTEPGSDKEPKEERRTESPHSDHSKDLLILFLNLLQFILIDLLLLSFYSSRFLFLIKYLSLLLLLLLLLC